VTAAISSAITSSPMLEKYLEGPALLIMVDSPSVTSCNITKSTVVCGAVDAGGKPGNSAGLRWGFGVTAGFGFLMLLLSFEFSRGHCGYSGA